LLSAYYQFLFLFISSKEEEQEDLSHTFWYDLCQKYVAGKWKSESSFLHSAESGDAVSMQHQKTFNQMVNRFREGTLRNNDAKQSQASPYEDVRRSCLNMLSSKLNFTSMISVV